VELIGTSKQPDAWVTNGASAVLSEDGYQKVVHLKNDEDMFNFVSRYATHLGCKFEKKDPLAKKIPEYNGRKGVKSLGWLDEQIRTACKMNENAHFGSIHKVVGEDGVLQLRLDSIRHARATQQLHSAGIVPTAFQATDARKASQDQLKAACPLSSDSEASFTCKKQEVNLKIDAPLGLDGQAGCQSNVEQAIVDSHRRALVAASKRSNEWTAILEDDVVPVHAAAFSEAFKRTWEKVPSWAKMVRLNWCTGDQELGSIRKETFADVSPFRLVNNMSWYDTEADKRRYYTGGCATGYMVHKSILQEMLDIFPCCCGIDCCMERQFFYAPAKSGGAEGHQYRGQQVMINMDAWDTREDSMDYTNFFQSGVLVQDNRPQ